jgi:ASTRA-associated protein 1
VIDQIDIFHLPSQQRQHTLKLGNEHGMVMALSLLAAQGSSLTVVAGYEDGLAVVATLTTQNDWTILYSAKAHSQPILSLDISPDITYFLTSSADAVIAKHPIPALGSDQATASIQLAEPTESVSKSEERSMTQGTGRSLLAAGLQAQAQDDPKGKTLSGQLVETPLKVVNTKHSGQQSLRIRSDGKIFATAGWDSRPRVYSAKTLKEVAVLKWHQSGCYAVALSTIGLENSSESAGLTDKFAPERPVAAQVETEAMIVQAAPPRTTVRSQRLASVQTTHWLAAGSKDGKVSLWDIF